VEAGIDERISEYDMKDRHFLATWMGEGGRKRDVGADEGDEMMS